MVLDLPVVEDVPVRDLLVVGALEFLVAYGLVTLGFQLL
jgi:hypothetical protein